MSEVGLYFVAFKGKNIAKSFTTYHGENCYVICAAIIEATMLLEKRSTNSPQESIRGCKVVESDIAHVVVQSGGFRGMGLQIDAGIQMGYIPHGLWYQLAEKTV